MTRLHDGRVFLTPREARERFGPLIPLPDEPNALRYTMDHPIVEIREEGTTNKWKPVFSEQNVWIGYRLFDELGKPCLPD